MADKAIDVTKFQNLGFTEVLILGYVALAAGYLASITDVSKLTALADFSPQMVILLAISNGAYLAGKIPDRKGNPPFSLDNRASLLSN